MARLIDGILMDENYVKINKCDFLKLCSKVDVIIKPAIESEGGKNVKVVRKGNDVDIDFKFGNNIIIQEFIEQSSVLNTLYTHAVNTIRIITIYFEDKLHVLSSVLRMGRNGSVVDNASSGGIFCGIDKYGKLKKMLII